MNKSDQVRKREEPERMHKIKGIIKAHLLRCATLATNMKDEIVKYKKVKIKHILGKLGRF